MNQKGNSTGKLFLIPTPLGSEALYTIPEETKNRIRHCSYFFVESYKMGRRNVKRLYPEKNLENCQFFLLNKHTDAIELNQYIMILKEGNDVGLMSDAGSPGIADPGAAIVRLAHQNQIRIFPLVGPSSITLALMGSGLDGQHFEFHGYLSRKKPQLIKDLRRLESKCRSEKSTQIFMETPYRNRAIMDITIAQLRPDTWFCIAADLSLPSQYIQTRRIHAWKKTSIPDLHKRPAIFLIAT